jgi:hypothetical protein
MGMVDSWDGDIEVRFFKNGSWNPVLTLTNLRSMGTAPRSIAGDVVIGTDKVVKERLFWRQVSAGDAMNDCWTWAFEVRVTYPSMMHLAAFAFDLSKCGQGNPMSRAPQRADV